MIWTLLYLAIGMALAWDTCRSCASPDGWAGAMGDATAFLFITLLWLPIVACVAAFVFGRRLWRR